MKLDSKSFKTYGLISTLAIQLVASIVLGVFLGHWLDSKTNISPFFLIAFGIIGLGVGLATFIKGVSGLTK